MYGKVWDALIDNPPFWLAARGVEDDANWSSFDVMIFDGIMMAPGYALCCVEAEGRCWGVARAFGFKPVFILKPDIHYIDDGTTKTLVQ